MTIILAAFTFISCDNKKNTQEEKEFTKAQASYDKNGMDGFCKYIEKNTYFTIKDFSQHDATPLLIAMKDGDLEKVKLFIEKGASVEEKDSTGKDFFDYAVYNSRIEVIDFAISKMPASYWNVTDSEGNLPLIKLLERNADFSIIQKCIDLTNDINHINTNNKTILMYAAQCSFDVRTVKYLLDKGANIDIKNSNEWTALMYAARYNPNPAVMEDLILRGANSEPNSVGLTVTMLASCNPNPGVLLTLLKYKNEINSSTDNGKTALMYACENNQTAAVIKMLIDNGADLNARDSNGKTVREYMSENASLTASDMAVAWKTLEENAVGQLVDENIAENDTAANSEAISESENSIGKEISEVSELSESLENDDSTEQTEGVEE